MTAQQKRALSEFPPLLGAVGSRTIWSWTARIATCIVRLVLSSLLESSAMPGTKTDDSWLKEDNPDLYLILRAQAGDSDALLRLESEGRGLALFALAMAGNRKAQAVLEGGGDLELDYVYGLAVNCQQSGWLAERHP